MKRKSFIIFRILSLYSYDNWKCVSDMDVLGCSEESWEHNYRLVFPNTRGNRA